MTMMVVVVIMMNAKMRWAINFKLWTLLRDTATRLVRYWMG
jgi:hypothetical protein